MKTQKIVVDKDTIAQWLKKAEQGDPAAQCVIGFAYWYGYYGFPEDKGLAFQWYQKAAVQGYAKAQNNLGFMYQHGLGVAADYKSALKCYQSAAEQGLAIAQCSLGLMYQYIFGDKDLANQWYQKADVQGLAMAELALRVEGVNYHRRLLLDAQPDFGFVCEQGIAIDRVQIETMYLEEAAEQGDADAQFHLGKQIENDSYSIIGNDKELLREWSERYKGAVDRGDIKPAPSSRMVTKDRTYKIYCEFAVMWYRRAAEQGHVEAQFWLGRAYFYNFFHDMMAFLWYHQAADNGHAEAAFRTSILYIGNFDWLPLVYDEGEMQAKWRQKSAEGGYAEAQFRLGVECHGELTAISWYQKAAKQGHNGALFALHLISVDGSEVAREQAKAFISQFGPINSETFKRGEDLYKDRMKYEKKRYVEGVLYEHGLGVIQDNSKAMECYRSAINCSYKLDSTRAQARLDAMERKEFIVKNAIRRKLALSKRLSSSSSSTLSSTPKKRKSTWQLPLFSMTESSAEASNFYEAELQNIALDYQVEGETEPEHVPAFTQSNDFRQHIDAFLSSASRRNNPDEWIELLAFISSDPRSLSTHAWSRLEIIYYQLFSDAPILNMTWLMAVRSVKAILTKGSELSPALERWTFNLFSSLRTKIKPIMAEDRGINGISLCERIYQDLRAFLHNELYPQISHFSNKEMMQAECIEWIGTISRYLEPKEIEQALLTQAIALSFYSDFEQKQQKIQALCDIATEVLDRRVCDWRQGAGAMRIQSYKEEQIKSFHAALQGFYPQVMLESLGNLIQFLLQEHYFDPQARTANAEVATIFYSSWLGQPYDTAVDHPQDFVLAVFRALWLRMSNLQSDAELQWRNIIDSLKLLAQFLVWIGLSLSEAERQRYMTRLKYLLQGEIFLSANSVKPIFSPTAEEKEALQKNLYRYWPKRMAYCSQLSELNDKDKAEDITIFWEKIRRELGFKHLPIPMFQYPELKQILLRFMLQLSKDRISARVAEQEGILMSNADDFISFKEESLSRLYANLEALWQSALKKMGIPPPCLHSLVLLGSWARREATLYSDIEFLLLIGPYPGAEAEFKKGLDSGEIERYFAQCFNLFALQIVLLGEESSDLKISYRTGIHLDPAKLVPFAIGGECFFGTPSSLAGHFKLGEISKVTEWPVYLRQVKDFAILQGSSDEKKKETYSILAASASYDARFFYGDKKLYEVYLTERARILSENTGKGGYTSRAVLALSFCKAAVLNEARFKQEIFRRIEVKNDFLSVISGIVKTLSLYHGLVDLEGLPLMDTRERCSRFLSNGIIVQEGLIRCLEVAHTFCDRFRVLSYAEYDRILCEWMLYGKTEGDAKCLWHSRVTLWKEAIVILHDVIYPLHSALLDWVVIAEQEFAAERPFIVSPAVLARCQETLLNEGRNVATRFAEVVYEILMEEKQLQGQGTFLPRLTSKWWQFLLVTLVNLSVSERQDLWQKLIPQLSALHREQFFETWDSLMTEPKLLQQQHPYLLPAERTTLCTEIAAQLNHIAAQIYFPDGWSAPAYRKQRQWQKAVAELFSESISGVESLERIVIQRRSAVVGCVDPHLSPREITERVQRGQAINGLFVLKDEIQVALEQAERTFFAETAITTDGKRHVNLFFEQKLQGKTHHFCLKIFPENPGMEDVMTKLQYSLGGIGELPDVYLWRIYTPFYPDGIAALLMEDARGLQHSIEDKELMLNLSEVRAKNQGAWFSIDADSFMRHFIRVLLTTPEDDKFNDYYVIPGHRIHGSLRGRYVMRRVDNERSLYISELFEHKKAFNGAVSPDKIASVLKVKTIIYCMEQMNMPLSMAISVLERIIQMDTKAFFKRWLEDIAKWNVGAREIFKPSGIMAPASSSSSSSMADAGDFSVAHKHCERNIYTHGVFHAGENLLYEKEKANFCLVVMPVPMDKFINVYLSLEELRQIFIKEHRSKSGLTGLKLLQKIRPAHYKHYYENLEPRLRIGTLDANDPNLSEIVYERFTVITQKGYKPSGESLGAYRSIMTSGLGELMQAKDYELILRHEAFAAEPSEADTAEWLVYSLEKYEHKQKWDSDSQMMEQMLLDRFQKILVILTEGVKNPLGFFQPNVSVSAHRLDQVITEFKNLSFSNKIQFRRHFLGGKELSGWNMGRLHPDIKKYLLRLLLIEYKAFGSYDLHHLDTEAFKDVEVLDAKTLLELLQKYGKNLTSAVIVTTFDPYSVRGFKEQLEACVNLTHLELRIVLVAKPNTPQPSTPKKGRTTVLQCTFPQLQSLTISGFTMVDKLILKTPKLKRLTLRSLINLESGEMMVQTLESIELYGCYKIDKAAFQDMFMSRLSNEQKMPLIQFENTGMQRTFFYTMIREMLRNEEDMKSKIALASQFTVRQWRALELLFADECKKKDYPLFLSDVLDKQAALQVLYTHPDFCSAFAKALMTAIKILSTNYPTLERVNILVDGVAKDMFEVALRLADDKTLTLAIVYNDKLLYELSGSKIEVNPAAISKSMMRM